MASLKNKKTQPREIIVAKINAKQAITIAVIGLMAALSTPFLTNHLSVREETVKREMMGYYEGRRSVINETIDDNLKTIKNFKDSIDAYGKRNDSENRRKQALVIADKIQALSEEAKEKIAVHTQEALNAYRQGDEIEASNSRAKANEVIRETDAQITEEQRRLIKEIWKTEITCGATLRTERSAIPLKPIPLLNRLEQFRVEEVATLPAIHEVGHISPGPNKSTSGEYNFVSINSEADLSSLSLDR